MRYLEGESTYTDLGNYVELPEEAEDQVPSSVDETGSEGREWPAVYF